MFDFRPFFSQIFQNHNGLHSKPLVSRSLRGKQHLVRVSRLSETFFVQKMEG